jgi:hypothetical protein
MVRAGVRRVPARSTPTPPVGEATKTQRPSGVTAIPNGLPPTPVIEIRLRPSAGADADAVVQRGTPAGATARTGARAGAAEAGMACDPVQPPAPSVIMAASTNAPAARSRPTGS